MTVIACPSCRGVGGGMQMGPGGPDMEICGYCRGEGEVDEARYLADIDPGPPEHDD